MTNQSPAGQSPTGQSQTGQSLAGQRVVIIGGASGIGNMVARLAGALGADLVLVGRNRERLERAAAALVTSHPSGIKVAIEEADAHREADIVRFFERADPIDHLVSMVGDAANGGFIQSTIADLRRVIESKFFANVAIAKLAAPHMRSGGSLCFTSSTGGRPDFAAGAFVGSRAIDDMVRGLAVELAPDFRVNAVAPTFTRTPMWRDVPDADLDDYAETFRGRIPLARLATIEEVAGAYLFLMQNRFVTGQRLDVDGGIGLVT
ncbi:SDR family NAD(P)-dependent oxidoreductase [Sphingomonas sp.]|uniref:SDR family NAD(P)-dependent oxidoreductase n=1 Tax=Sphingomonas sp. TaxID=28214 RepID=UPI003D6D1683